VTPKSWGSSKKRKGSKFSKEEKATLKRAQELGFKATGLTKHQVKKAEIFLKKKQEQINNP
jgi:hypothetical protein